jgi:hypothetical protein
LGVVVYVRSVAVFLFLAKFKNWTFGKEVILEVLSSQKWEKRKLKITWCVYILGFQLFSQKYIKKIIKYLCFISGL